MSYLEIELANEGYSRITNIDFSDVVINIKSKLNPNGDYKVADVRDMSDFENDIYDVVLDKGTFDCVISSDNALSDIKNMLNNIYRVLRNRGVYICFSYSNPSTRLQLFQREDLQWTVICKQIARKIKIDNIQQKKPFYCYICEKQASY